MEDRYWLYQNRDSERQWVLYPGGERIKLKKLLNMHLVPLSIINQIIRPGGLFAVEWQSGEDVYRLEKAIG